MSRLALSMKHLRKLENQSWESAELKKLYSTPLVPGFPWYTAPLDAADGTEKGSKFGVNATRRHVVPYTYTFKVFAKGRWMGRSVIDVYREEFGHHRSNYYELCWRQGRLRLIKHQDKNEEMKHNLKRRDVKRAIAPAGDATSTTTSGSSNASADHLFAGVDPMADKGLIRTSGYDAVVEQGDVILHTVHRHEVPLQLGTSGVEPLQLLAAPISSCGLLVVHKPSGVPTHPTGRYYYNSVLMMLEYVLAPKRLRAWLWEEDALLQSLVCTSQLTEADKQEVQAYYGGGEEGEQKGEKSEEEIVNAEKAPRPCYRLDKATSGILLLGVHQDATAHVASVLMDKSNSVDRAVQSTLLQTLASSANQSPTNDNNNSDEKNKHLHDLADTLVRTNFGVRKRYLARVRGNFPATLQHLLNHMEERRSPTAPPFLLPVPLSASQMAVLLQHSQVETVLPSTGVGIAPLPASDTMTMMMYPQGVLIASPVEEVRSYAAKKKASGSGGGDGGSDSGAATNAVTIVQCLSVSSVQDGKEESLLLCMPLTGRQNQIRLHCRDWLCPIVNDPLRYKPSALFSDPDISRPPSPTASGTSASTALYFDEKEVPPAFYKKEFPEELKDIKAKLALARSEPGSASERIDVLASESICYECSAELPVATYTTEEGTSSICLHAWEYEMESQLLYSASSEALEEGGGAQGKRSKLTEDNSPSKTAVADTEDNRSSPDAVHDPPLAAADKVVVFRALPLPAWV